MLTALVLICSVAVTPDLRDCSRNNAITVMRVPAEFESGHMFHARTVLPGRNVHWAGIGGQ